MNILDLFKKTPFKAKQLTLDEAEQDMWPQQIVAHLELDDLFKRFVTELHELTDQAESSLAQFTDEGVLAAIPDRARTMNALHGNEYAIQARKFLKLVVFTDLFLFEKQQDAFFEASSAFKDQTAKNVSVLKEFMHEEIKATQELMQQLEDRVLTFAKILEDAKFPHIRKMHELQLKLRQRGELQDKYAKLLVSLQTDLKRTQEKKTKLSDEIAAQIGLIRNQEARQALEKLKNIDEELHVLHVQYASICQDVKNLYKKHPDFKLAANIKQVIDELPKDPESFLAGHADEIKKAFEDIVAQLEEEQPGNTRGIIERLSRLLNSVEQDSKKVQTTIPDQRMLKKEMMKDIAALQVYDKRQFLMRAQSEEEAISIKITYLTAEMDPNKRMVMEREMKDAAHALDAMIKPKVVVPDSEN